MADKINKALQRAIKNSGLSQEDFGLSIGVKKSTFNNYIHGRRELPNTLIEKMFEVHHINPAIFFDEDAPLYVEKEKPLPKNNNVRFVELPLYGDIAAGALSTLAPVTEDAVEQIQVPIQFLNGHSAEIGIFALLVNGESMNEIIPDHSYVICLPLEKENLSDGQIVIFSYDGEYSMKRFINNADDEILIFRPESTDQKFRDIVIDYHTTRDLKVYAKVIGYYVNLEE